MCLQTLDQVMSDTSKHSRVHMSQMISHSYFLEAKVVRFCRWGRNLRKLWMEPRGGQEEGTLWQVGHRSWGG